MNQPDFSLSGAVDLSARTSAAQAQQRPRQEGQQSGGGSPHVIDVTEETFNTEVVERSYKVPVVLDVWADWCQPCKQLSPLLEKLADEGGGQWLLAKVDADANQRLAQALQVQSLPTVLAVVGGQLANLFTGALPEDQVRQMINRLLEAVGGQPQQDEAAGQQQGPPEFAEASQAMDRGDFDGAAAAYQRVLDRSPGDPSAQIGLAVVDLVRRTRDVDDAATRREAAERPDDVDAQCRVADLDMLAGRVNESFDRLIGTVRRSSGEDRDRARKHLLGLFEVLPQEDSRVTQARASLASALF